METTSSSTHPRHLMQSALLTMSAGRSPTQGSYGGSPDRGRAKDESTAVIKRRPSVSPQLFRCPGKTALLSMDFSPRRQQLVASVTRRNERERNRVRLVNAGFQTLRQHVPNGAADGRLSKVETLRSAVEYIRALQQLLDENQAVSAALRTAGVPSPPLIVSTPDCLSVGSESPHSTCSSSSEPELMDFTTWLHRYTHFP